MSERVADSSSDTAARVVAVVVSFRPDTATLARVVRSVSTQVARVVVVDNASEYEPLSGLGDETPAHLHLHRLDHNAGVGAAQNAGIDIALAEGADFVLLLDQDSVCAADMVSRLLGAVDLCRRQGADLSAVGPQYRGGGDGPLSGFVRFGPLKFRRVACSGTTDEVVEADFLISSGALIPASALRQVGLMEEALFIDHVDTEWFLRARYSGLRCFGVCAALMEHSLGEGGGRLWLGRWRFIPRHHPFRYYYIVRNSVLLYGRDYAPARWVRGDLLRLLVIALFNLTARNDRLARLRMMWHGLRDGLAGRSGPLGAATHDEA